MIKATPMIGINESIFVFACVLVYEKSSAIGAINIRMLALPKPILSVIADAACMATCSCSGSKTENLIANPIEIIKLVIKSNNPATKKTIAIMIENLRE